MTFSIREILQFIIICIIMTYIYPNIWAFAIVLACLYTIGKIQYSKGYEQAYDDINNEDEDDDDNGKTLMPI